MIDIEKIDLVLIDYDDTACIHRHLRVDRPTRKDWDKACVNDDEDYYMNSDLFTYSQALKCLLEKFNENGVDTTCITWSKTNRLANARMKFLHAYYGSYITDLVIVGSRIGKLEYAETMAEVLGISRCNILIVEDHPSTLLEFREAGFKALSMSELNSEYEAETDKQYEELLARPKY